MRNVTKIIMDYLYNNDITKSQVARKAGYSPQNFNKKLTANDLSISFVAEICKALDHNFFNDIAIEYGIIQKETKPYPVDMVEQLQILQNTMVDYIKTSKSQTENIKKELEGLKETTNKELKAAKKSHAIPKI